MSDSIPKYEFEVTTKFSFLKNSTTSSFKSLRYGVKIETFFIFNFFKALIAAVLGVVTFASGLANLIFFYIELYPAAIVPDVHP